MTPDELTDRLRRTLESEAATVTSPEDAWERFSAAADRVVPLDHARRRLRVGVPAGIVGLAAAVIVAVLVTRGPSGHGTQIATGAPSTAFGAGTAAASATTAAAAAAPAASGPTAGAAAPRPATGAASSTIAPPFAPLSVTFVSPTEGWVLGSVTCATNGACPWTMRHTLDGGVTWTAVAAPPGPATHLRFADASDGWAWDGGDLWSTHDGAATWAHVTIPGLATAASIEDLEVSAGVAHVALTQEDGTVRLAGTPVGSDSWSVAPIKVTLGAGPVPTGQIVLQGGIGWFVQLDRVVVDGARLVGGRWQHWTPPCATVQGPAVLAASGPRDLAAACDVGLWSTPKGEQLFVSHDGGTTWSAGTKIPVTGGGQIAAATASSFVVAGPGVLVATFDGGATWSTVARMPGTFADLGFTTPLQGVAVLQAPSPVLVTTHDGGRTWTTVTFAP